MELICSYCGVALWTLTDLSDIVIAADGDGIRRGMVWCTYEHYDKYVKQLDS